MKKTYYLLVLLSSTIFSQTITVDNASNSAQDLVNLLVNNSCVETSNYSFSSNQSVAYFNQNGSAFPITEGVIIRSGNAIDSQGIYTDTNLGSPSSGGGADAFLQNLSNVSSGTTGSLLDLSYLQFDFTSISSSFNFNFLFASNEYGAFQCLSNDIFAFELTDLTTGITTNIAVIPTTTNPISVKFIKDALYNGTCSSTNPTLFDIYNVSNPAASTLNMRGHTVVMSAGANIVPLNPYRLKLVIADYISSNFDSAVFISAGSFTTDFTLGPDQTICSGDSFTLDTLLDNTYSYQWFLGGSPIAGAINPTYEVTQPGTYMVEVRKGTCFLTDEVIFNDLTVNNPNDLFTCDTGLATNSYDLTINNETTLGIDNTIYDVFYYETLADIATNNFIPVANLNNYTGTNGQTIFIKIFNTTTNMFCDAVYNFDLLVTPNVVAGTNITAEACEDAVTYDLSLNDIDVINGQLGTYTITYYNNQADAQAGNNAIGNMAPIPVGPTSTTYWFRIEDSTNANCFDVTSILITINPLPIVDSIADVQECSQYQLQALTNGTYYLLSGGPTTPGQVQYNAGDIINTTGLYYIFVGPDANGCTNESDFELYFVDEYVPTLDNCGQFIVPDPPYNIGAFYSDFGGPTGAGVLIPTGTVFTNNTQTTVVETIYYYAEAPIGTPCRDERFDINIHPIPLADAPLDETHCNSYTLPALTNGQYFSGTNGTGTNYPVGHVVSSTETIYIYNIDPVTGCDNQNPLQVNIVDTTLFSSIYVCESYTLPAIIFGGYFDAPNGGGNAIDPNTAITTSQTVYYYTSTSVLPNCTDSLNYDITIYPKTPVDDIADDVACGEFILPLLTNGNYYTGPNGTGTSLNTGDFIDLTGPNPPGTYYVYNEIVYANGNGTSTTCYSEDTFTIIVEPFPGLDQAINQIECSAYSLAQPPLGDFYTESDGPNGTGTIIDPTTEFTTTETFYLYYEDPISGCSIDKEFQRIFKGINLPVFDNIEACDFYRLPTLNNPTPNPEANNSIRYYTLSGGPLTSGQVELFANHLFNTTNTTETVYVYGINADGHLTNCFEEKSFTVTILRTPTLPDYSALNNRNYCGTYTLPALPPPYIPTPPTVTIGNYSVNYYSQQGGNASDVISPTDWTFTTPDNLPRTYDIWVYAYTTVDNDPICFDEEHFQFTVYPLLDLVIEGGIICVNALTGVTEQPVLLNSGLDPVNFTVEWYLNSVLMGTGPTYLATQDGTYDVIITKLTTDNPPNCNYKPTTVIVGKSSPAIATISVSEPFDNIATITINVDSGFGTYEFQLDGGNFQTSNQFYNVSSGFHTVIVRDVIGYCGDFILTDSVIKYPKFFTPNFDGHNETWNITDLITDHPESIISIFDRYGKLIKQISPAGIGWDGTFNNQLLPSTDYWFNVNYIHEGQEKIFRAHFTLKR